MIEWQPIETAPKDGTTVVLGYFYLDEWDTCMGSWGELGWQRSKDSYYHDILQGYFSKWSPIPPPPREATQNGTND